MGNVSPTGETPPTSEQHILIHLLWILSRYWTTVVDHVDNATLRRRRRASSGAGDGDTGRRRTCSDVTGRSREAIRIRMEEDSGDEDLPCECSDCEDASTDFSYSDFRLERPAMSPNSEEDCRRLPAKDCVWSQDDTNKQEQRPPVYNPEDYAMSLRKWGKRPAPGPCLYTGGTLPPPPAEEAAAAKGKTLGGAQGAARGSQDKMNGGAAQGARGGQEMKDYRNPNFTPTPEGGEMSLKQFNSVSELLGKLKADLRLAFPSFVQEFIGDPLDGVTLLLELLRAVQLSQAAQQARCPPPVLRRALLDEHSCLLCLRHCLRCADAGRRLSATPAGLFTLAVCIMSNVSKSRVIALELLTKACEPPGNGHGAVSEALSTLRLRFGEPVRFRFLVGMLSSGGGCPELQAAGISFLNTFLETAPSQQSRIYIQAELEQAGFQAHALQKVLPSDPESADKVLTELERWERNYLDISVLRNQSEEAGEKTEALQDKVALLERRVKILLEEKKILLSLEQCLKERCCSLEDEVQQLRQGKRPSPATPPAEDEGINSSDQDDVEREPMVYEVFAAQNDTIMVEMGCQALPSTPAARDEPSIRRNGLADEDDGEWKRIGDVVMMETSVDQEDDEETTIDEVIEELRNIINDAESEEYAKDEAERMQREMEECKKDEKRKRKGNAEKEYYDKGMRNKDEKKAYDIKHKLNLRKTEENGKKLNDVKQNHARKANVKKTSEYNVEPAPKITIQAKNNDKYFNKNNETQIKSGNNKVVNYFKNHGEGKSYGAINVKITSDDNNKVGIKNHSYLMNDLGSVEVVDAIETELEIVPVKLLPQPPRKSRTVVQIIHGREYQNDGIVSNPTMSPFFDDETPSHTSEEDSDSLLSAARDRRSTINNNNSLQRNIDVEVPKSKLTTVFKSHTGNTYRYQVNKPDVNVAQNGSNKNVNVIKRSESLHHVQENLRKEYTRKDEVDVRNSGSRRGSFDGLFFVTDCNTSNSTPKSQRDSGISDHDKQWESKKLQSKSLDRIDEGLDSLVDIVITPDRGKSRFSSGRGSSEDWSLEWGDSYCLPGTRKVVPDIATEKPPQHPVVIVTRSASIQRKTTTTMRTHQHVNQQTQQRSTEFKYGEYQSTRFPQRTEVEVVSSSNHTKRYPPDGSSQPMFPPKTPSSSRGPQYEPSHSPTNSNPFIIKRGHTNAGLYSGHHNIGDSPGLIGIKQKIPPPDYVRNVSPVLKARTSIAKVTDLPSGMY